MLDHDAEKSASIEPDSLANAMMPACHCGTAMKRMATAHCSAPEESSPRESGKEPEAGSD
jgi:hypothetical protein